MPGQPTTRRTAGSTATALAALALAAASVPAQGFGPPPVDVSTAVERQVGPTRGFVGTVLPTRRTTVGAEVEGRVLEFPVDDGDRVAAGSVLARLDTETVSIEIAGAEAELSVRESELEELHNGSRPEEIAVAKARVDAARAEEDYRNWALGNAEKLFETKSVSEDELQSRRRDALRARAARAEAAAELELLEAGPRKEKIAQAEAQVAVQKETVRRLEDQLARHTIKAPFEGYVVAERTEVGAWLAKGDPVVELVALDRVEIEVPVPEDTIRFVAPGQTVAVGIAALPGETFPGRVTAVVPQADLRARTFPVRIQVDNRRDGDVPLLKAGLFAEVRLPAGAESMALLVPKDALVLGGPQPIVFAVDEKDGSDGGATVRAVPVRTGESVGDLVVVEPRGELRAGSTVVVRGNERLRPDQAVHVVRRLEPEAASPAPNGEHR